ncbi:MAG TPA: FHA domain-containing protein [Anaerolineales bacterium]|jgi:pSer/pThr/pTyr-binding forkhead associated (FHA) protein|nr:FHA domain-containing protein [Anaerolineales bacterium]
MDEPQNLPIEQESHEGDEHSIPENAVLIIEGTEAVALKDTVIKIGRSHDNTIVIDDPRVSRHHLELRAIHGNYVLFDLGSSGGTFINGQRTAQGLLYSGDILSLAGVTLLFRQGLTPPSSDGKAGTEPFQGPGEHATAILHTSLLWKKKK